MNFAVVISDVVAQNVLRDLALEGQTVRAVEQGTCLVRLGARLGVPLRTGYRVVPWARQNFGGEARRLLLRAFA